MLDDAKRDGWFYIDQTLAKNFHTELHKTRNIMVPLIKNNSEFSSHYSMIKAKEEIAKRPRRTIMRVDYSKIQSSK
jgi:hypothetical protein